MTHFVVGTTMAAYVTDDPDTSLAWLYSCEEMCAEAGRRGDTVEFFAALQLDGRGLEPFGDVIAELDRDDALGSYWTYALDDGRTEVTTANRLRHIVTGANLVNDYAMSVGADYLLFVHADCEPPADAPWKLAQCARDFGSRVVGGEVPAYNLSGPQVHPGDFTNFSEGFIPRTNLVDYPVQLHMPAAALVLLDCVAYRALHWRYEPGLTDDPCLYADAVNRGYRPVVRKDVIGRHYPEAISAIEYRFPGRDMGVVR